MMLRLSDFFNFVKYSLLFYERPRSNIMPIDLRTDLIYETSPGYHYDQYRGRPRFNVVTIRGQPRVPCNYLMHNYDGLLPVAFLLRGTFAFCDPRPARAVFACDVHRHGC